MHAYQSKRIPVEPSTPSPICSITKQLVCALLLYLRRNPIPTMAAKGEAQTQFTEMLHELLPMTRDHGLTITNLCICSPVFATIGP
jgi:hypothetical protein